MSAHGGKADKTGDHRVFKVPRAGGAPAPTNRAKPAYSKSAPSAPSAPPALGTAGTKALLFRARKELAPLEDPNQSPSE